LIVYLLLLLLFMMFLNKYTDTNNLHLLYEMRDSMIENVRKYIFEHERKI